MSETLPQPLPSSLQPPPLVLLVWANRPSSDAGNPSPWTCDCNDNISLTSLKCGSLSVLFLKPFHQLWCDESRLGVLLLFTANDKCLKASKNGNVPSSNCVANVFVTLSVKSNLLGRSRKSLNVYGRSIAGSSVCEEGRIVDC